MIVGGKRATLRLFDAHCHLQDPRISALAPHVIQSAVEAGVVRFAVNGVSEKDWHIVKQLGEQHSSVIPCFGLHPWYVMERSPLWLQSMKVLFATIPFAAVGEIGLDKGSHGKNIDFSEQVDVFQQQLLLAKELERPVSIHCVRAFGEILQIIQCNGPFTSGVILHSFMGSAEMVPEFIKLGCYFSFFGFLTSMKSNKAKKMLKSVPIDRILFESDAPDALPKCCSDFSLLYTLDSTMLHGHQHVIGSADIDFNQQRKVLNHPANIQIVLKYVATLLEISEEELAEASYRNTMQLFSFPGSKVIGEI
ncbi:hypothetical protein HPP92_001439 [Vanilla planifolia]|uniref:TatD related DNase n=1 Tax=Vanilla planifolia TaxID=51239 RepID=A0A835VGY1_VANPL|nr:hypothetical protein HPP92_001439 [Vanilla planifolia]